MFWVLVLGLTFAAAAPWAPRWAGRWTGAVMAAGPAGVFLYFLRFLPVVGTGGSVDQTVRWAPSLGVDLALHLDGLSLLFALLITGMGALVAWYAGDYLKGDPDLGRFYFALLLFLSAMLGLVLSSNVLVLFVFWELTSFSSYLLIGYRHDDPKSRDAALQALLVTGGGGLALLAGFVLLGVAAGGVYDLGEMTGAVREHRLYPAVLGLIAVGCFTKSAQFPFHFWLPNAMAAPTPVSAYLHSATMVKAGVYLLARLDGLLGGTEAWVWLLALAGGATMLLGAIRAVGQTDLKKILAYSTLTALGTLTLLVGLSFEESIRAAMVFLVVHALYKGALFLVAGSVDHETGTRDIRKLGGLFRAMPYTGAAAVAAGLSMAGLPPLFGFMGKELAYKAKLGFDGADFLLPGAAVAAGALTAAAAGLVVAGPFFGRAKREAHEAPLAMWAGPALLGLAGLVFGLFPGTLGPLLNAAAGATLGRPVEIPLKLWYGVNLALGMSVATALLGLAGYVGRERLRSGVVRLSRLERWGPETAYTGGLQGVFAAASRITDRMGSGGVQTAILWILATAGALLAGAMVWYGLPGWAISAGPAPLPHEWAIGGIVAAGAVAVVVLGSRLAAVIVLGVSGFGIALLFLSLGAPDLAMTQMLVETLIVVILLLVAARLPRLPRKEHHPGWLKPAFAAGAGLAMAWLTLAVTAQPFDPYVSDWFIGRSVPEGFGRNVVNVILVDFRALDTLGEITVLAVAAFGMFALARHGLLPRSVGLAWRQSVILMTATRLMIPVLLLASLFLLWRGHNEPGGGFIGGLTAAGAFVLHLTAYGRVAVERLLRRDPRWWMAVGLAVSLAAGFLAAAASEPYMTGQWVTVVLGQQTVKLGTPLLFDVGVYLVVVGFTLTSALALEKAASRSDRLETRTVQ